MLYTKEALIALAMSGHAAGASASASQASANRAKIIIAACVAAIRARQRNAAGDGRAGRSLGRGVSGDRAGVRKKPIIIVRAKDHWRGSTMYGYVYQNGAAVYKKNFRMTKNTVDTVLRRLQEAGFFLDGQSRNPNCAIPGRFKLAVALYFFAQGSGYKAAADCASLGESTVQRYVNELIDGTLQVLKPIYMPAKPPSPARLAAIRSEFAARRGVPNVAMAVDGSHVPFKPDDKATAIDYRNYKGWTSILAVAFVTPFFLFAGADVGAPGRAGDNTVLKDSWLMNAIKADREAWLGPNGVIAADGGASDHSDLLLNPYRSPDQPAECWYNFCHSSTRFFVEETFGRWKNRFRFLLRQGDYGHKMLTRMTYASMILHNLCTIHRDDAVTFDTGNDTEWQQFHKQFSAHMCPCCVRLKKGHCIHIAHNRSVGRTHRVTGTAAEQRDSIRDMLWAQVEAGTAQDLGYGELEEARMHGVTRAATDGVQCE